MNDEVVLIESDEAITGQVEGEMVFDLLIFLSKSHVWNCPCLQQTTPVISCLCRMARPS